MVVDDLKNLVTDALDDLKGRDARWLDVRELTNMVDHMVIVSGTSNTHVRALADSVVQRCKDKGIQPLGMEGEQPGDWVLIDLTDLLVHVMLPSAREFYDLERLWGDFESPDRQPHLNN